MKLTHSCKHRLGKHRFTIEGENWYNITTGKASYLYCEHCEARIHNSPLSRILFEPIPKRVWDKEESRNRDYEYE